MCPSIWTSMTSGRLKIAFQLILHQRQRSLQLSSELVWPAAIPVLGLPHPIMLYLLDWEEGEVWDHWGLVQMSTGSPLKSSLAQEAINRRFFPPHHRLSSCLVSPICKRFPLYSSSTHCLQGTPLHQPPSIPPSPPLIVIPDFPKIHPSSDVYLQPRGQTAANPHCSPSLTSTADQSFHTFNAVIFHINYSGLLAYEYKSIMSACYPQLQLGDWRWYFMGAGDRRSRDYTVQTLST